MNNTADSGARIQPHPSAAGPSSFSGWLERASQSRIPEMKSLAAGIERDRAAVIAALAHEWSNGTTEGHINLLKTLKMAMYGRAKFELLRIKVLAGSKRGAD
jgi:transposase